jgi:hypothetical protein
LCCKSLLLYLVYFLYTHTLKKQKHSVDYGIIIISTEHMTVSDKGKPKSKAGHKAASICQERYMIIMKPFGLLCIELPTTELDPLKIFRDAPRKR